MKVNKIILWKLINKNGTILNSGVLDHRCNIDKDWLKENKYTLIEKEFEINYDTMKINEIGGKDE